MEEEFFVNGRNAFGEGCDLFLLIIFLEKNDNYCDGDQVAGEASENPQKKHQILELGR